MRTIRLGDVCEKIGSGATPRGGSEVYLSSGVSFIRSQNVYNNGFKKDGLAYISNEHAKELENVTVKPDDVLLNITGDSVARVCQVPEEILPARVNQHVSIIRPRQDVLDARYLRYFLISPEMQQYMLSLASAGATRQALTKGMVEAFEVPAPPLPEQKAIASILGALDDKIELNRKMNETLESLARVIFKSWFVDFDPIPGFDPHKEWQDSPMGRIPKGWRVEGIGDVVEFAYGKALKEEIRQPGHIPVFGSNGQVGWHNERLVEGPGIVIGRKGNPGIVTWVSTDFYPIDTTFYVLTKGSIRSMYYLYHMLRLQDLPSLGADSAVPGLNRNMAYMNKMLVPPPEIISAFDGQVKPLADKINHNNSQSRILATIRDTLLPKLLSGEIRVKDAEKFMETVS